MMNRDEIVRIDKSHVWHPYTPMDKYINETDPIVVVRAEGAWLEDINGTRYLDGNSSWWVTGLGHNPPRLLRAMHEQASKFAHCSLAGIAHEPAARLAQELCAIAPSGLTRVFYTDNGSGSIEVALRAAVQMWQQLGAPSKRRLISLAGAFHGDTLGAARISEVDVFQKWVAGHSLECIRAPFPDAFGYDRAFEVIAHMIRNESDSIAALVLEPIVQGAAGMRIYSPDYLRHVQSLCRAHDVLLIVDEVFTGYGRTGPMWGGDHASLCPDMICLGKTFASILPMGAMLATERVFDAFRGPKENALYYGHTFCGHPLGAAVAREVLAIYREEQLLQQVAEKAPRIQKSIAAMAEIPAVKAARSIGMIGAIDLDDPYAGYRGESGWKVYEEAKRRGAYLRPMGSTVYLTPPLTLSFQELDQLLGIMHESIVAATS